MISAGTNVAIAANGTISATDTNTQRSDASVRGLISATGNSSYNSSTGVITSTDTQPRSNEYIQDLVGAMFTGNTETNTAVTYQDSDGTIDVVTTLDGAPLTTEVVQDIVGAMFTSNTETRITADYQDADGTIDLVVDAFPTGDITGVTAGAGMTGGGTSGGVTLNCIGGSGITVTADAIAIDGTVLTTSSDLDGGTVTWS
jgi:hypothetical protein